MRSKPAPLSFNYYTKAALIKVVRRSCQDYCRYSTHSLVVERYLMFVLYPIEPSLQIVLNSEVEILICPCNLPLFYSNILLY